MSVSNTPAATPTPFEVEVAAIKRDADLLRESYTNDSKVKTALLPVCAALSLPQEHVFKDLCEELPPSIYLDYAVRDTYIYKVVRPLLEASSNTIGRGRGLPIAKAT